MFDMKKQLRWSKLKVGIVMTLALLILFMTVFFAGGLEEIFSPKVELRAQIGDVKGLRRGAPVWLSGIEIGQVKDISLHPEFGTVVTLSVDRSTLDYLRKDAQASVLTMGLLGDKYVELSAGSPAARPIEPRETIKGVSQIELKDIMETSAVSINRLTEFLKKLDHLVTKIEEGEGSVARFISDPSLYENLKETTQMLSSTVREMRDSRGTLKLLIEDPTLYKKLVATTSSLEALGKDLNEGTGTMGKLMKDPSLYDRLTDAASRIDGFGKQLTEGSGTLRKLAEDPTLYDNLSGASLRLTAILEKVEKGEGVAGTLVKDEALANDLKQVVGELRELTKDIREHPKRYFKFSIF